MNPWFALVRGDGRHNLLLDRSQDFEGLCAARDAYNNFATKFEGTWHQFFGNARIVYWE